MVARRVSVPQVLGQLVTNEAMIITEAKTLTVLAVLTPHCRNETIIKTNSQSNTSLTFSSKES